MQIVFNRKGLLLYLIRLTCVLLLFTTSAPDTSGCSWDHFIWMIRSKSADPLYRFVRNSKAGYIDRSGNVVIGPRFDVYSNQGGEFHNGLMLAYSFGGKYVNTSGKPAFDNWYGYALEFSEGLAAAGDKYGEKWGYINTSGEFVIPARFDVVPSSFSEGMAAIRVHNKFGYIDRSGEFVIPPKFLYGGDFHEGMALVITEGPCTHTWMGPCPEDQVFPDDTIPSDRIPWCKYGYIDRSGALITARRYDSAKDFAEGMAPVQVGERWGYIDKKGQVIVEPKFDDAEPFADGLALVRQGQLFGYIDRSGAFAISPEFRYAEDFAEGLAVVGVWDKEYRNREFYYINKEGKQAIPEKFALASRFFKGLAHVRIKPMKKGERSELQSERAYAYIDTTGKRVFTY